MKLKHRILLLLTIVPFIVQAQNYDHDSLILIKNRIEKKINVYQDSLELIETQINIARKTEFLNSLSDSSIIVMITAGAQLRIEPAPYAATVGKFDTLTEVIVLDFYENYFGVCAENLCGYINEVWILVTPELREFQEAKIIENKERERLRKEQQDKIIKEKWAEIEQAYIKKYGQTVYNKLRAGQIWIGMTNDMAVISQGSPNSINRTVGSWGVHEQWVYNSENHNNIYLYFENGKLTAFQD